MLEKFKANWYIWLFPVFAIAISAWLFLEYLDQQGPAIKISFDDASSIREEKTQIRYRGVAVGTVKEMELSNDNSTVVVTVVLHRSAKNFAREGAQYWIVTPKVGFQGITGLETIFEGPYIAAQPGSSQSKLKTDFQGQLAKNVEDNAEDMTSYLLEAPFVESVSAGDPVSFRGLNVGRVSKVNLSKTAQNVQVHINVQNRFTKLIRTNTIFWRKVGIQADLGLFKSEVKMNSLEGLLKGGIDLFTPEPAGPIAKAHSRFVLFAEPPKNWEKWNPKLEFDLKAD
jgi:paraquat-inducible protein B